MLPLAERLKRSHLFTKAYSARKSVVTPFFTLYVLPRLSRAKTAEESKAAGPDEGILPMTGFVVSKKASKSACRRNRMKRRIREAYRSIRTKSLNQWYVMVLVIKESALDAPWADLVGQWSRLLMKQRKNTGAAADNDDKRDYENHRK